MINTNAEKSAVFTETSLISIESVEFKETSG